MTMKRYLIPILLGILVFVSGVAIGCGQKQKQQEIKKSIDYLENVNSLALKCVEKIGAVGQADEEFTNGLLSQDNYRLFEAAAVLKKATDEALDTVNAALSSMANLVPPPDAITLHHLMTESLEISQKGLVKMSLGSAMLLKTLGKDYVYTREAITTSEALVQGRQLLREALSSWKKASAESANLFSVIEQKSKN